MDDLRGFAVSPSLFKSQPLERAIETLGFVQADPIRASARAQDLTLRVTRRDRGIRVHAMREIIRTVDDPSPRSGSRPPTRKPTSRAYTDRCRRAASSADRGGLDVRNAGSCVRLPLRACRETSEAYGVPANYVHGAKIAGFTKVANAMLDLGLS